MKKSLLFLIGVSCYFMLTAFKSKTADVNNHYNYHTPLNQLIPSNANKSDISLLVQKSSYSVFVNYKGQLIKSYPCVFGKDPVNDKQMKGDNRTPEGNFKITSFREHFIWGYFIGIDYPNEESWAKFNQNLTHNIIPQDANIGGSVGFHGVVDGLESFIDTKNNWTEGCISLKNQDITEIANYMQPGISVKIVY